MSLEMVESSSGRFKDHDSHIETYSMTPEEVYMYSRPTNPDGCQELTLLTVSFCLSGHGQ